MRLQGAGQSRGVDERPAAGGHLLHAALKRRQQRLGHVAHVAEVMLGHMPLQGCGLLPRQPGQGEFGHCLPSRAVVAKAARERRRALWTHRGGRWLREGDHRARLGDPTVDLFVSRKRFGRDVDFDEQTAVVAAAGIGPGGVDVSHSDLCEVDARSQRDSALDCDVVEKVGLHRRRGLHLDHRPAPGRCLVERHQQVGEGERTRGAKARLEDRLITLQKARGVFQRRVDVASLQVDQ